MPSDNVVIIPDTMKGAGAETKHNTEEEPDQNEHEQQDDIITPIAVVEEPAGAKLQKKEVEDAQELAKRIVHTAKMEHDKIIRNAKEQAFEIKEQARKQGYKDAQDEIRESLDKSIRQVNGLMSELQERQDQYFVQYEDELKELSISIAEKILHKTILSGGSEMEDLIKHAISSIKGADWISVELSDKLIMLISQLKRDFSSNGRGHVEFVQKSMPVDHVVVKSSEGVIDASVPVQLDNLRGIFKEMAGGTQER